MFVEKLLSSSWIGLHNRIVDSNLLSNAKVAIFGDSIVKQFGEIPHFNVWKKEVGKEVILFGIGGIELKIYFGI